MLDKEQYEKIVEVLEETFEIDHKDGRQLYEGTGYWGIDIPAKVIVISADPQFKENPEAASIVNEEMVELEGYAIFLAEGGDFLAYSTDKYVGEVKTVEETE